VAAALAFAKPWFIEEPTSPDDVEGHRRIREAMRAGAGGTGEMCQNRIVFKQFIMRGAIDVVQVDACRLGGVNEVLAVHADGREARPAGLPACGRRRAVRIRAAPAMIDFLCIAGTREGA
jgi:L-fuconate dehydratase